MSQFTNDILKTSVGQICQTIGFHGIYSMPLDVLTDLLHRYMTEVCRLTHRYTEHCELFIYLRYGIGFNLREYIL